MRVTLICLIMAFSSLGCKKDSAGEYVDPFYFKATIGGQTINWVAPYVDMYSTIDPEFLTAMPTAGGYMPFIGCSAGQPSYQFHEGTAVFQDRAPGTGYANAVAVTFVYSGDDFFTASNTLVSSFTTGPKTYGDRRVECRDPVVNGVLVTYTDANGTNWNSRSADASNSFEQVSLDDETRTPQYRKKWKARFSCRLYDDNGNSMTLVNGEIYGPVFPF